MKAIRHRVKDILASRSVLSTTVTERIRELNPVLRGWDGTSQSATPKKLAAVDRYVYLRLAIFLRRKRQRSNLGWSGPKLIQQFKALGLYRLVGPSATRKARMRFGEARRRAV